MQISAKARLVSLIVALVFMAGALIGSGVYLIVNHLNKSKAMLDSEVSSTELKTNIFNTDGTINATATQALLEAVGYYKHMNDTGTYKAHQIRTRTYNASNTNTSATYNPDDAIIFPMGYAGTDGKSGESIYWQATYLHDNYITIWMVKGYTNSAWDSRGYEVSYNSYANSTIQNYLDYTLWGTLTQDSSILQSIFVLPSTVGYQDEGDESLNWDESDISSYWFYDSAMFNITTSTFDNLASSVYSGSYLWLPSFGEVFNNTPSEYESNTTTYTGQWGLNSNDRAFDQTNYDGSDSHSCCSLRSSNFDNNSYATVVYFSGDAYSTGLYNSTGVRPAAHLSLDALAEIVQSTPITLTENIYTTDGEINPDAVTTLLETVQYFGHENDTATYTAHQIASRNNTAGYNSDRTIVFPMGYVNGTSGESIYWRATYLHNNYLTIWMVKNYTNSTWNESGVTVNYTAYANSTIQNYLDNTLWSALTMGSGTLQSIFELPATVGYQDTSTANTTYWYTTNSIITSTYNNLASAVANSSYLWLPSAGETMNNQNASWTNNTTSYTGQWGLNSTDRSFNTSNYDGTSTSYYCWLRSGHSGNVNRAMRVNSSGSAYYGDVDSSYGVRPAAHLDLDALANLLPKNITITTNNSEYGQVFADGQIGESITVNAATGEQVSNLIAVPNAGYAFLYWENASTHEIFSELNPLSFTVTGDITLTAVFGKSVEGVAVSIAYQNTDGTITTNQDNIPLAATGEARITGYTTLNGIDYVHFSAVAYTGYYFVGWQVDGEILIDSTTNQNYLASANIPYNLIQDKQVFAVFALIPNQNDMNTETDNNQTADFA